MKRKSQEMADMLPQKCPMLSLKHTEETTENSSIIKDEKCGTPPDLNDTMNQNAENNSDWRSMREFNVLDECDENDGTVYDQDDSTNEDQASQSDGSYDSEVPSDEIDSMLEEGLPEHLRGKKAQASAIAKGDGSRNEEYQEREKIVLDEKGRNHFEVLPEGWVQVTHNSGMPIYLHKKSRVCTLTMPYFLGPGSARKHGIPLSSIPCLQYFKALQKEEIEKKEKQQQQLMQQEADKEGTSGEQMRGLPSAKIETVQENMASHSLDFMQVREYCSKLFKFKTIKVTRFPSWSARRQYTKQKKHQKQLQRPSLPEGTRLITFPVQPSENAEGAENGGAKGKKEWVMNPNGKSYVCILHEYVQHALKKQPAYEFKELENAATPYGATVLINDMKYGDGYGTSKKQAKSEAAKATLEILIPEMREQIQKDQKQKGKPSNMDTDLCFFDEIKIEDPRVAELCAKTCEPSPYAILLNCLQRNFRLGTISVNYAVNNSRHQKNEYTMTVGKHTTKVICKNKRDGKQRASQAILQALHPHVGSWGSLLRMYGNRSVKSIKEKKQEEQEITLLQSKAAVNSPNFAILNKLQEAMDNLHVIKVAGKPIGKFIPPDNIGLPSSSGADLNNVDL